MTSSWPLVVSAAREVNKAAARVGEVHEWAEGPHRKMPDGSWEPVVQPESEDVEFEYPEGHEGKKHPEIPTQPSTTGKPPDVPKDPEEARAYMEKELGWGVSVHPANAKVIPLLADLGRGYVEEFPFMRGFIDAIGDVKEVHEALGSKSPGSGMGALAAVHYGSGFKGMGLSINFKGYGSDPKKWETSLADGVETGFHPEGSGTLKATIDHEMGHVLTKALHTRDPELKKMWQSVGGQEKGPASQSACRKVLSGYAATNIGEFISEAWSEYRNSPNPRPMAKMVGDRYTAMLKKKQALVEGKTKDPEGQKKLWTLPMGDLEEGKA